jgi:hypothetical protein
MARKRGVPQLLGAVSVVFLLLGCEQFFTYSPIVFLQRPVSDLTLEQQIQYGEDALASGDAGKMTVAYEELDSETDSPEAQYIAAQLAIELSGVPEFMVEAMDPESGLTMELTEDPDGFMAFVEENGLDPAYLVQAAENLQTAQALGVELEPMDYLMGTLGLLIGAATQDDGTLNFGDLDADKVDETVAFITQDEVNSMIESLPLTDPMRMLLSGIQDYAETL